MDTGPLPDLTNPLSLPPASWMWLSVQVWLGFPESWHVVGIRNACWILPSGYGFFAVGLPSGPSVNPSAPPRRSMPRWLSYEWFSIIRTTMCLTFGIVSVPGARRGLGSEPG